MQPRFETRQFALVGIEAVVDMSGPFGQTVDALWRTIADRGGEVENQFEPPVCVGYWFMPEGAGPSDNGYLAAVAVREVGVVPEGFVVKQLPESSFAVFEEAQRGQIGGPGGYAYNTWLPASPYEFNGEVNGDLEVYDAPPCGPYGPCEIWVPVRPKE